MRPTRAPRSFNWPVLLASVRVGERLSHTRASGLSEASVRRIWKRHGLKPHLFRTSKLSNDPLFVEKVEDIVGLYLNPPEHALVWCADEKSHVQALDRTPPGFPMKKGRSGTMTHDYKRNGTPTLFAARSALDGKVMATCAPRHRHQERLKFLRLIDTSTPPDKQLHLVIDNSSPHQHPAVQRWIKRHSRFHVHFTPTSASWLNDDLMSTLELKLVLPESLTREAEGSGLLTPESIEALLRAENTSPSRQQIFRRGRSFGSFEDPAHRS